MTIGEAYTCEVGYEYLRLDIDDFKAVEKPKITFNANDMTIKVEGELVDGNPVISYYLDGAYDDGSAWTNSYLYEISNGTSWFNTITLEKAAKLGIQQRVNGHDYKLLAATDATAITGEQEISMAEADAQNISVDAGTYKLQFFPETMTLSAKKINYAESYLIGDFNEWTYADESCKFSTTDTEGVYELKYSGTLFNNFILNDGTKTFGICYKNWYKDKYMAVGSEIEYVAGEVYGHEFCLDKGVKDPTITLNTNNKTITVSGEVVDVPLYYSVAISSAEANSSEKMTDAGDGVYTKEVVTTSDQTYLTVGKATDIYSYTLYVASYWPKKGNVTVTDDETELELWNMGTGGGSITVPAGTYTLSLDSSTMKLTITKKTDGISTVGAETVAKDAPAYNLAGQRVNKETKGLLIIGGKKYLNK